MYLHSRRLLIIRLRTSCHFRAHLRELCCSSHPIIRLRTTATSCAHLRELCCSSHPVLLSSCARSKAAARRAGPESKSTGCSRAPRPSELPSILGQARAVAAALKSALEQASLRRKPRESSSFFSRQSAQSLRSSKGANSTHSCLRSSSSALALSALAFCIHPPRVSTDAQLPLDICLALWEDHDLVALAQQAPTGGLFVAALLHEHILVHDLEPLHRRAWAQKNSPSRGLKRGSNPNHPSIIARVDESSRSCKTKPKTPSQTVRR